MCGLFWSTKCESSLETECKVYRRATEREIQGSITQTSAHRDGSAKHRFHHSSKSITSPSPPSLHLHPVSLPEHLGNHGQLVQQRANCLPRRRQWLGRFGRYQSSQTHATLRQAMPHRHAATPYSLDQSCHRSSTPSAVSTIDRATCYELVARRCFAL